MNRIINESSDAMEEDSKSSIESESEDNNYRENYEEIETYGLKSKLYESLLSFKVNSIILGSFLVISYFFIPKHIFIGSSESQLKNFILSCGLSFISYIFLGIAFESISMKYLKRSRGDASYCYYFNEISFHLSALVVITIFHQTNEDFYILKVFDSKIYLLYTLRLIMFAIIVLSILKILIKYISMRFNYNMYLNQIRKCILFDLFVSTISIVKEDEDSSVGNNLAANTGRFVTNNSISSAFTTSFNAPHFILQKNFRKEISNLSFSEKRLLIKEFLNLADQVKAYSDFMPAVLGKIKEKANSKAIKLYKKLKRNDKIKKVCDLTKYFTNKSAFSFMLLQLGLEPDQNLEKSNLSIIIENTYKDRYVIKKNIEQINSAISRVYISIQLIICAITIIFMFITATVKINQLTGLISTIFGTQFISKILSDNVMQSILFLFVIHPFDTGDRVLIRLNGEIENLVVAELNIFSTTFYKFDGTSFFVPNSVLIESPICNIRRSGSIMETHSIQVNSKTDPTKLEKLREMLIMFCKSHSDWFTDYILVNYEKIENSNKLYLKVLMQYRKNFQQYELYLKLRSEFINELNRCLNVVNIRYNLPTQRVKIKKSAAV